MRLITRSDFDGLACAALLEEHGVIDDYLFVHPKDMQDGKVQVAGNDVLANVPFVPGCGMWFDHHSSEEERLAKNERIVFKGASYRAPSCARVIYDHFGGAPAFWKFDENGLMEAVDKSDSGSLTVEEIKHPKGWVLLSFIMDPRTGLGRFKDYRISNHALMKDMIGYCRTLKIDEILELPDVQERVDRYFEQEKAYRGHARSQQPGRGERPVHRSARRRGDPEREPLHRVRPLARTERLPARAVGPGEAERRHHRGPQHPGPLLPERHRLPDAQVRRRRPSPGGHLPGGDRARRSR